MKKNFYQGPNYNEKFVFDGGTTLPIEYRTKTALKAMVKIAFKNRLIWSGHVVVNTQRALNRAYSTGLLPGAIINNTVKRSLIASGFCPKEVEQLRYVSQW
jgi:hypothetical protein